MIIQQSHALLGPWFIDVFRTAARHHPGRDHQPDGRHPL